MSNDRWVAAAEFGAGYEADIAVAVLASGGIPALIDQGDNVGLLGYGFSGNTVKGVRVLVPLSRLEEARALLNPPVDEPLDESTGPSNSDQESG